MKTVISFALLTFSITGFSQTFGELGDEWHNSYAHHVGPSGPGQGTSHVMEATGLAFNAGTLHFDSVYQLIAV